VVVHLAGRGDVGESRRDPVGYAELNATRRAACARRRAQRRRGLVLASTQRVYPLQPEPCHEDAPLEPDSPYGYAKWVAELWCRMASAQLATPTTVLRFFRCMDPASRRTVAAAW